MKALVAACCACLLAAGGSWLAPLHIHAEEAKPSAVPIPPKEETFELRTLSGEVYHNSRVIKVTPADLTVMHENGVARIPFENLSQDWRSEYQFDPGEAAEYRRIQKEIQTELEKERLRLTAERAKQEQKALAEKEAAQKRLANASKPAPLLAPLPGEDHHRTSPTTIEDPFPTVSPLGPVHETGLSRSGMRSSQWRYSEGIYSIDGYAPPYVWGTGYGYGYGPGIWVPPVVHPHRPSPHPHPHHQHGLGPGHHHGRTGIYISPPMFRITR